MYALFEIFFPSLLLPFSLSLSLLPFSCSIKGSSIAAPVLSSSVPPPAPPSSGNATKPLAPPGKVYVPHTEHVHSFIIMNFY